MIHFLATRCLKIKKIRRTAGAGDVVRSSLPETYNMSLTGHCRSALAAVLPSGHLQCCCENFPLVQKAISTPAPLEGTLNCKQGLFIPVTFFFEPKNVFKKSIKSSQYKIYGPSSNLWAGANGETYSAGCITRK